MSARPHVLHVAVADVVDNAFTICTLLKSLIPKGVDDLGVSPPCWYLTRGENREAILLCPLGTVGYENRGSVQFFKIAHYAVDQVANSLRLEIRPPFLGPVTP